MTHQLIEDGELLRCEVCGMGINPQFLDLATLPRCRPRQAVQARSETAVVVISHNYGRFLGESLDSVLAQTRPAAEILVVDDASDDETAAVAQSYADWGVRYLRVDHRHVYRARLAGLEATSSPYLVFLDADDCLPPNYLQAAEPLLEPPGVGLVATDLQHFGLRSDLRRLEPGEIERRNWIHCSALVKRAALTSVPLLPDSHPQQTHDDWFLWRQIVRAGWRVAKSPVPLLYRKHGASMSDGLVHPYRVTAGLDQETVQIVLPLSGRWEWLPRLERWVVQQTWPRVSLLVLDSSTDPVFRTSVRAWLADRPGESQYVPLPPTGDVAELPRLNHPDNIRAVQWIMPQLYNAARQRLSREYVLWLEDDVLPPHDAISRLMDSMSSNVAAVSGVVPSRYQPQRAITWNQRLQSRAGRGDGVDPTGGTGFGCLLIRRSVLRDFPLHSGPPNGNYDQAVGLEVVASGLQWLIDWSVLCDHAGISAESLPLRGAP